jgi:hypothetical protein
MNTDLMPNFWKLSHGWKEFSFLDMVECIDEKLVYIHRTTAGKGQSSVSQAEEFVNAPIGDYFYLTHGNQGVYLLGQFTGPVNYFTKHSDGWMDRPFRQIQRPVTSLINRLTGRTEMSDLQKNTLPDRPTLPDFDLVDQLTTAAV